MTQHVQSTHPSHNPDISAYQRQFTNYLRDPLKNETMPSNLPPRIGVYARLLFNKIEGSLHLCFPIFRQLLDEAEWRNLVRSFIRDHRCQTPLYREIPDEFIDYLINETPTPSIPAFMKNLAHFEWMELVLETADDGPACSRLQTHPDLMTGIPLLNPVLHLLRYAYPVHKINPTNADWSGWKRWRKRLHRIKERPIYLAGLRDKNYRVQFIQLSPASARLIELFQDNFRTGEQAALQLAIEMQIDDHTPFLNHCRNIIEDLKHQQIIVGVTNEK
ncbi:DUF2063 domain-containing protein [Methylotuvimicrobium sp. KM1]|uniref:HvfC family RiPP maturation protein n=1 Tax=Methylotuvimicrobium sp. KM1 TaxID=3377707 RepID=UPI00384D7FF8